MADPFLSLKAFFLHNHMRSIKEIYNQIIEQKDTFSELDGLLPSSANYNTLLSDLSSGSKVAIWRLWAFVVAVAIYFHERIFAQHKVEVKEIAESMQVGKLEWYESEIKKFQLNFPLSFDNDTFRYYYLDTTSDAAIASRIIARVSVKEVFSDSFNGIRVKVAKYGESGTIVALSEEELSMITYYIQRFAFAGVAIDVQSKGPDLIRSDLRVWYDGTLLHDDVLIAVKQALNDYLTDIPFDATLYRNKLIDALQDLPFIKDIEIIGLKNKIQGHTSWISVGRYIEPDSGYFTLDPLSFLQLIPE